MLASELSSLFII